MVEVQLSLDLCRPTLKISYILLTILIAIVFLLQWYSNSYLIMLHNAKKIIFLSVIIRAVEGKQ